MMVGTCVDVSGEAYTVQCGVAQCLWRSGEAGAGRVRAAQKENVAAVRHGGENANDFILLQLNLVAWR